MKLIRVFDFACQLGNGIRAGEPSIRIDVRLTRIPLLARSGIRIEDGPDRASAIRLPASGVAVCSETRGKECIRVVHLIPESVARLVYQNQILKTADGETGTAGFLEHGAVRLPSQIFIAVSGADMTRFRDAAAAFVTLIGRRPKRRADIHGQYLAVGILSGPGFAGDLVFLRQPRIEHASECDIARMASRRDDDSSCGPDVHILVLEPCRNPQHFPRSRFLANDLRQPMVQENLNTFGSRTLFQRPDDAGSGPSIDGLVQIR